MSSIERMPLEIDLGRLVDSCIDSLYEFHQTHIKLLKRKEVLRTDTANRYVCGYPIPYFQRQLCWSSEQEIAFLESVWMGFPLGSYSIHDTDWGDLSDTPLLYSAWLIDGQQRLTAIERYWSDLVKINGLYWSELTRKEQSRFKRKKFTHYKIKLWDESNIKKIYNRMAFGGKAHSADEMAV